ncbi:MAG: carbohydrate ABC transporter permease [Nocardiopsaceae bacterium]|nr:carbohydrate ABC transporter permease [Nocardiopsaceae bacterium]
MTARAMRPGMLGSRPGQRGRPGQRRNSPALTAVMTLMLIYTLLPLAWLLISSTKNTPSLFSSFGLWFGNGFHLWSNISEVFSYQNGIYLQWFGNTALYAFAGAGGSALIATLGGYSLAKYKFKGRKLLFAIVLGAISVPGTALAVPTYLLFAKWGLINTPWAVIIPSLCSPFGLYLMRVYSIDAIPDSLLEASRIDGAGELRTLRTIAMRLLAPGFVTVLLFSLVATWNNYFLPLVVLSNPRWYPLTVGLASIDAGSTGPSGGIAREVYPLVITGSLLAIIPLVVCFLFLQRFWQSGLAVGSVKQ